MFHVVAHAIRLDWGPVGARATPADIAVVVDVLSFSTAVCVAVERGTVVLPYRWRGRDAERFAAEQSAVLAVGRLEASRAGSERWDRADSLRPCVEDLLGAGAIVSALGALGYVDVSPEAALAEVAFTGTRGRLVETLTECASGIELRDKGFGVDVDIAAALDVSSTVPLLTQGAFVSADEH